MGFWKRKPAPDEGWAEDVKLEDVGDEDVAPPVDYAEVIIESKPVYEATLEISIGESRITFTHQGHKIVTLALQEFHVGTRSMAHFESPEQWGFAAGSACECPPCPGRGNDGHGMTHCAECCFGTGVVADIGCPIHGEAAVQAGSDMAEEDLIGKIVKAANCCGTCAIHVGTRSMAHFESPEQWGL